MFENLTVSAIDNPDKAAATAHFNLRIHKAERHGVGPAFKSNRGVFVNRTHAPFNLAFLLRLPDPVRINMKSHRPRIGTVAFIDPAGCTRTVSDSRLQVVDPVDGRDPAEPLPD